MDKRIIVALDVNSFVKMQEIVKTLDNHINYYKVGMELYYSVGSKSINYLKEHHKNIFLDLKLYDIPNTVAYSVSALTNLGANLISLHASGGRAMMSEAVRAAKETAKNLKIERPKLIAVTALTSFDEESWQETGAKMPISENVIKMAQLAQVSGVDGVVASPKEASLIREVCGKDFLIVTPGIRPTFAQTNDQKRVMTPLEALNAGANKIVIGRPITSAVEPLAAAKMILDEIKE